MRILFLTSPEEDYLSDALLHGFKTLGLGEVVDYPRKDLLYRDCPEPARARVRGGGFTVYTVPLAPDSMDRSHLAQKLEQGAFDLVIFSDIWRHFGLFVQWRPYLRSQNTILMDGSDSPQVYPHAGYWWRRPYYWFLPRATAGFLYFKREWTGDSRFNLWHRALPARVRDGLPHYAGLRRTSFSIPREKIVGGIPAKTKDFTRHIVDAEVAARVPDSAAGTLFATEHDYYADIQASRFGITTKRSGWDCLRHYEIAANGAVPCFRDLDRKPATCAPHGLEHGRNCLSYRTADELMSLIGKLDQPAWRKLAEGALSWARANTTQERARETIEQWRTG